MWLGWSKKPYYMHLMILYNYSHTYIIEHYDSVTHSIKTNLRLCKDSNILVPLLPI